jgi:hypothetical protein
MGSQLTEQTDRPCPACGAALALVTTVENEDTFSTLKVDRRYLCACGFSRDALAADQPEQQ